MTDHPIIFSGSMIRALLAGRKTMTRRLAWRDGPRVEGGLVEIREAKPSLWQRIKPGDLLWVKEGACLHYFGARRPGYRADWSEASSEVAREPKWTPAIHMPRWASRLTLHVTATKIERLQGISEGDAKAEGIEPGPSINGHDPKTWRDYAMQKYDPFEWYADPRRSFQSLWQSIHGPGSWDANPEVVAISFDVLRSNMSDWQPIETAPKDMLLLLFAVEQGATHYGVGQWRDGDWHWDVRNWDSPWPITSPPTHWQPLPPPPEAS